MILPALHSPAWSVSAGLLRWFVRLGLMVFGMGLLGTVPAAPRILWTNETLVGSPEPPTPYVVEPAFPRLKLKSPLYLADEPGSDRLWVVLQGGEKDRPSRILSWRNSPEAEQTQEVLEISRRQLIYGLTFHPGFSSNRWVYLFCNGPTGDASRTNRILRYRVSAGEAPRCEPESEKLILEWFSAGHDGGDLAFGLDGMLYITAGDGSSDSDTYNSGQDLSNLLATLIRINVDQPEAGRNYSVPSDNPFVKHPGARPEIWAYGFRNPWRMDIDRRTGDIWVGNNGQDLWETAYLVRRGDNYGWSVLEGSHPFYPNRRRGPTPISAPIIEHAHSEFRSLTGGVVYQGGLFPSLTGAYVYGDYSTGKIWGARHREGRLVWHQELADTTLQIVAFRNDQHGNLLVVDLGGGIYRLSPRIPAPLARPFPKRLSETGLFSSVAKHLPHPGLIPYVVNVAGWVDGAQADRFIALSGDAKMHYAATRGWNFTNRTVLVQTLSLPGVDGRAERGVRVETRLLVRDDNEWQGYSYAWNVDQTEAYLVSKEGTNLVMRGRPDGGPEVSWRVPSRADCLSCHARAVNYVLGLSQVQLNCSVDLGSGRENQLEVFRRLDLFHEPPPASLDQSPRLVNPYDETQELEARARSYLHANCSVCHVEAGGGNARMELEFSRSLEAMNLVSARPQHDTFGLTNAMIIAPGLPDSSVMVHRISQRGRGQMPPLGTSKVDERAIALMRRWIAGMKSETRLVRDWKVQDLEAELVLIQQGKLGASDAGKQVFRQVGCVQCHRLGGEGGSVGPDLTDVGRRLGLAALLESLVDPSKTIADGYVSQEWETKDGEVITGTVEREENEFWIIRTASSLVGTVRLAKSTVVSQRASSLSNMPSGMLNSLEKQQVVDLLAYVFSGGDGK
ncbi:MAG: PQQ-dependent sugar dehydrogenase [Verrucomicrobiales bacterium]|nr:PQQ-dependent sugar dehydrogenase [Verrucomicrobiales bacterium]